MLLRHYSWLDEFAFNYPPPYGVYARLEPDGSWEEFRAVDVNGSEGARHTAFADQKAHLQK